MDLQLVSVWSALKLFKVAKVRNTLIGTLLLPINNFFKLAFILIIFIYKITLLFIPKVYTNF